MYVFTYCLLHTVPIKVSKPGAKLSCEKNKAATLLFNRQGRVVS